MIILCAGITLCYSIARCNYCSSYHELLPGAVLEVFHRVPETSQVD